VRLSRYRTVGDYGEPYPNWMRELRGERGVYVIRNRDSGEPVWVGHSTTDLRKTITRHFQAWGREARSRYANYDYPRAGVYEREDVEVSVAVAQDDVDNDEIYERETALVCDLRPEDNEQKTGWCDASPDDLDDDDFDFDDDAPF
jgi:hypothetical protein